MAKNRLEIEEYDDYFSLEFSWYSSMSFFILLFTIIWNAFLFFWYSMAFTIGAPWIMVIFPLIHVAIGLIRLTESPDRRLAQRSSQAETQLQLII